MFGFARRDDDNGRDQQQQDQLDQQDDDRSVRPKTPLHLPANTLLRMDRFEEGGGRRESGGGVGEGARGGDGASHPPDLGSTSVTPPPASKSSDTLTKPPNGVFESGKGGEKVGERDEGEIIERVRGQIPQSKSGPASPLSRTGSLTGDYPSGTLPKGPPQSLTKLPKSREGDILLDFQGIGGSRDDDSNNRRTNVSVSKLSPRMDEVKKVESHTTVDETVGIDSDTTIDDSSGTGSNPATSSPDTSINVNYSEHTSFSSGGGATEEDASGGETVEEDAPGIELDTTVSSRPAEISAYREHSIAALDSVDPANASTFDEDKSGGVDKHNRLASPGSEGVEEDGAPKTDPDPFAYSDGPKDKPGLYDNNITFVSSMNGDGIEEEAILETATSRSRRVNRASVGTESQALNNVKDMPTSALAIELFPSSLPEASAVDLDHGKNQGEQDQEATDGHMRKVQGLELDEDLSSGSLGSLGTSFIHDLRVATRFSSTRGNRGATKTLDISSLVDKSIAASDMPYSVKFLGSVLWHQMVGQSKHASMSQFLTSRPTSNCEVYHNDTQENYADSVTETSTERANGWPSVVSEQSLPNVLSSFVTELGTLPSCQKRSSAPSLHTWEAIVHESQEEEEGVRLRSRVISKADSGLDAKMLVEAAQSDMACFESIVKQITKRNVLGMTPKDNLSSNFGTPFSVGIKSESAVVEKAERKYLGDVTLVKDVLRAQIVLPSETQLVLALLSLQHICDFTKPKRGNQQENDSLAVNIARIKNLFRLSPLGTLVPSNLPTGYRHIIVNLRMKSGLIAEIQLHLEQMFTVLGNDGYKLHRDIIEIEKQRYSGGNEHEQGSECQQSKRNPLLLCRCAESLGISDADGSIDMITGKLISMAKAKSKGAAKKPSFSKKGDGEDTASHVVPMDPGAAMMAAIAARKGPSEEEEKKGEEEAPMNPRAAMMAAIAARKGPSEEEKKGEEEAPMDPRAAMMAAIAARKGPSEEEEKKGEEEAPMDPRAAMMAAIAARKGPSEEEEKKGEEEAPMDPRAAMMAAIAARKGPSEEEEKKGEEEAPMDPRAAMMAAIAARKGPSEEEEKKGEEEAPMNPRAAMMAAIAARKGPSEEEEKKGEEEAPMDPRAAMMAAIAARKGPSEEEEKKGEEEAPMDPRAAMMAAIVTRKGPSEKEEKKGEEEAPMDPRAAMMAAIAARKGPSEEEEKKGEEEAPMDPRAAMMAAIAARKGPSEEEEKKGEEEAPMDPRAAMMAAIAARKGPSEEEEKKGGEEEAPMDPRAAMMAAIAARKGPSEEEEKKGEEEAPMDPRAAMMAAIAVRKGPSDDDDTADKENAWKDGMEKGHVGNLSGDAPIPPGSFLSSHLPALDDNFEFLRSLSSDLTQLSSEDVINAMLFSGQEFLAKDESEVFSYICLHEGFSVKSSLFGSDKDMKLAEQIILQGISVVDCVSAGGTTTRVHNCLVDVGLRNSERALEMLASLAVFEGTHRDWGRASDTLQSAVLRCENSLPLYHPVTIASIIDLAAAHLNSGCEDLALSCITRANRRIGFYLREQEDAYLLLQRESSVLSSPFAFHRQHTNGVGIAHLSMLKAYVATLLRMERRKMARLCGPKHPMSFLFHCYLGDALAVLGNCIGLSKSESLSSTQICLCCGNKEDAVSPNLTNSTSDIWELAGSHYRTALQGWIRSKGPFNDNISATACSLARCLRECGRRNEAIKVLALVARKAKQVSPQSGRAKNESGPMCLWSMAVFSAEESTTEVEGRKRAGDILGATAKLIEEQRMELPEFQFAKLHALVEKELSKMKS